MNNRSTHRPTWKDILEAAAWAIGVFIAFMILLFATRQGAWAQTYTRKGNTFIQQPSKRALKKDTAVSLTPFTFIINDVTYPVYKTSRNAYFIVRINKKGKSYRKYVTKEIMGTK